MQFRTADLPTMCLFCAVVQHAERLGFDSDRLDAVRVSASRSSPVADTLDLAAKYMDEASLGEVVTVLTGVVRRGKGC